jgi:hypothetical protein
MNGENSLKVRSTVVKVPDATPGLLFLNGQQRPFTLAGVWKSPVAPAPNMTVDVDLDGAGTIEAITVVDTQQLAKERLSPPAATAPPQPIPSYKLFDSTAVAFATFFGSPIAGAALMALNYRRLGKGKSAILAMVGGLVVTGMVILLAYLIPPSGSTAIAIVLVGAMKNVAKALQGAAIEQHLRQVGSLGSSWTASGLGLGVLAVVFGGLFLFGAAQQLRSKVVIGSSDAVYYSGSAKKEEARTLGEALKTIGFFSDKGAGVILSKGKDGTVVSFVVKDGVWNQPEAISAFEEIVREIAPSVGGFPIKLKLLNSGQTKKELMIGRVIIGTKDELYYFGSATESDASALGQSLKSAGFFQDRGVVVLLSKGDDGTAISFVVKEGTWDNPNQVADFEGLVRQAAPSVGGLPIKLLLRNSRLETMKSVTVS